MKRRSPGGRQTTSIHPAHLRTAAQVSICVISPLFAMLVVGLFSGPGLTNATRHSDEARHRGQPIHSVSVGTSQRSAGATCLYDRRGRLDRVRVRAPRVRAQSPLPVDFKTGVRFEEQWVGWRPLVKRRGDRTPPYALRGERDEVRVSHKASSGFRPNTRSVKIAEPGDHRALVRIMWFDPRPAYRNVPRARTTVAVTNHFDPATGGVEHECGDRSSILWSRLRPGAVRPRRALPVRIPFSAHPVAGDFNGDGAEDLYLYEPFTGDRLLWGDGRYLVRRGRSPQMELERVPLTGDFDGNDVDDVYWYGTEDLSDEVWWGTRRGKFEIATDEARGAYVPVVGDYDGDGLDDIMWATAGASATEKEKVWWGRRAPRGFEPGGELETQMEDGYEPVSGNFDGDCCGDVMWRSPESDAEAVIWRGESVRAFTTDDEWGAVPAIAGDYQVVVGNFDGGCCDDVYFRGDETPRDVWWWGSRDDGFVRSSTEADSAGLGRAIPVAGDFVRSRRLVTEILWLWGRL